MSYTNNYAKYWAEDIVAEFTHNHCSVPQNMRDWVLRWCKKRDLDPEEHSVTAISDVIREDFLKKFSVG